MDNYSEILLRKRHDSISRFSKECLEFKELDPKIRLPNLPEDFTENIVKFIIRKLGDTSCIWCKHSNKAGDLVSELSGKIEVKSFTSSGPSSFGPKKVFDVIYFIDMTDWLHDKYILWKVNVTSDSEEWKSLKMNKLESHSDKSEKGQRPRIQFSKIREQIPELCEKVFEGSFDDIFTSEVREEKQLVEQST